MGEKCQAQNKTNGKDCNFKSSIGNFCKKHENYILHNKYGTNAITITFGDRAENHKGMQIIGQGKETGYSLKDFESIIEKCNTLGINTELYNLKEGIKNHPQFNNSADAYVLVIKNGVKHILKDKNEDDLYDEHIQLKWDTKALMYGRVVNKSARYNLCYGETRQEADYEAGKGTIIPFDDIKLTKIIKDNLSEFFGELAKDLVAEGNLYHNINYNGIGFHGDSERKIVIAIRLGNDFPLRYRWYYQSEFIGNNIDISLSAGDIYIMSDKAVGYDWKLKNTTTLRHAAGCDDFIDK